MVTQKRCLEILLHDHKNTFFDSFFLLQDFYLSSRCKTQNFTTLSNISLLMSNSFGELVTLRNISNRVMSAKHFKYARSEKFSERN